MGLNLIVKNCAPMQAVKLRTKSTLSGGLALLLIMTVVGCDVPVAAFRPNAVYVRRMELGEGVELSGAEADIETALVELFGTPDAPQWPDCLLDDPRYAGLVDPERLRRAAGPVRSDENDVHFGLFREHCVQCHGITGNGLGPTSRFLNPYPRDFRPGVFKFKSTPVGSRPTRQDLNRILHEGIVGTSMPSFRLLKPDDVEALTDYLIYLSIRGQVERELVNEVAFELDYSAGDRLLDLGAEALDPEAVAQQWNAINGYVEQVADEWLEAEDASLEVAGPPEEYPLYNQDGPPAAAEDAALMASVSRGREIYLGKIANCASCHGPSAMGDGQVNDFDSWTKEWTTSIAIDPKDKTALKPMLALGALKPRHSLPRNLRNGIYRGGSRPIDIYRRIVNGIDGTPMPAAAMQPDNPLGLTETQVWDLVNYILSLPDEANHSVEAGVQHLPPQIPASPAREPHSQPGAMHDN